MVQVHLPASPIKHMLVLGTHLKYDKAVFLALQASNGTVLRDIFMSTTGMSGRPQSQRESDAL